MRRIAVTSRNGRDELVAARAPLAESALPVLTQLRDATNETAFVSRRSGWFAYLVEFVETAHPVRLQFERGQAFPLHKGGASRLLLSALSAADRAAYFELMGIDRDRFRPELLADPALDVLREDGLAESNEEVGEGIWSVAAAVREERQITATVSVAAPLFRLTAQQRSEIRRQVVEAARSIEERLLLPRAEPRGDVRAGSKLG